MKDRQNISSFLIQLRLKNLDGHNSVYIVDYMYEDIWENNPHQLPFLDPGVHSVGESSVFLSESLAAEQKFVVSIHFSSLQ